MFVYELRQALRTVWIMTQGSRLCSIHRLISVNSGATWTGFTFHLAFCCWHWCKIFSSSSATRVLFPVLKFCARFRTGIISLVWLQSSFTAETFHNEVRAQRHAFQPSSFPPSYPSADLTPRATHAASVITPPQRPTEREISWLPISFKSEWTPDDFYLQKFEHGSRLVGFYFIIYSIVLLLLLLIYLNKCNRVRDITR